MNITFFGGASQVTGSCYLLNVCNKKILIDCGLEQDKKSDYYSIIKKIESIPQVDACFITHAHIDHSGLLPALVKRKKIKSIYSTPATKELARLLLEDTIKIQSQENGENVLYSEKDLEETLTIWETRDENNIIKVDENIQILLFYNAHILGSVSVYLITPEGKFLFTGDLGTKQQKLMDSKIDIPEEIDYLFIETTYGNRVHNPTDREKLHDIIEETCKNSGRVLIPVFAVGRLQEILYEISKKPHQYKVYVDTPLGNKIITLTEEYKYYLSKSVRKKLDDILFKEYHPVNTANQSKELARSNEPCIILSASGMIEGGRILNHIEVIKNDPKSTLVFVGYQAEGTRGRKIYDNEEVVACRVEKLSSFSAHADKNELLEYFERLPVLPYKTYLVHGEEEQRKEIKRILSRKKIRVETPNNYYGSEIQNLNIEKKVVISVPLSFFSFSGYKISPCIGYIIDNNDNYEIVPKEWYDNLFNKETDIIIHKIKEENLYQNNNGEADIDITIQMDFDTIRNNIRKLTEVEVYTKSRKKEFWQEFSKGKKSFLKYIEDVHKKNPNTGKRRWAPPRENGEYLSEDKAEHYYDMAYKTGIALLNLEKSEVYSLLFD